MEKSLPAPELPENCVGVLDAGGQYKHDIVQQVKRLGYYAVAMPLETAPDVLEPCGAIIISGGPQSVHKSQARQVHKYIRQLDKPQLGICYGMQLINYANGGKVTTISKREDGFTNITIDPTSAIFDGLESEQTVLMSHGDSITKLAPGFRSIANSDGIVAGIASVENPIVGLQFHPEVATINGPQMLENFLTKIARLESNYSYTIEEVTQDITREIQDTVADKEVLAFVSGGVDSTVLACLLERSLEPEQLHLVYVDTGFMREGETQLITDQLRSVGLGVHVYNACGLFLNATTVIDGQRTPPLHQVTDPEIKRVIIGDTFMTVQERMSKILGLDKKSYLLAQGTLHTDLIESGSEHAGNAADTIKSHHNDTPLVRELRNQGRVVEPLQHLQKDDVRAIGKHLKLPSDIVNKPPFPGPGLAIRVICADEQTAETTNTARTHEQLEAFNQDTITATLLPVKTVGVQGDNRSYSHLVALSGEQNWPELIRLANEIPRTVHGVNRVVYVFGEKLSEVVTDTTPTHLNQETLSLARQADHIGNTILNKHGLDTKFSQVPFVVFPVPFDKPGNRSLAIRTFNTDNFKTGFAAEPGRDIDINVLDELVTELQKIPGISRVAYDLTSKPPATTEWE